MDKPRRPRRPKPVLIVEQQAEIDRAEVIRTIEQQMNEALNTPEMQQLWLKAVETGRKRKREK
jgi:hypothetical protein